MKYCVSTDVGTWTNWLTFEPDPDYSPWMPEPDCFLHYCITAATQIFTSGKFDVYVLAAAATHGFTMVLFTEPVSRRNTFIGGTCAPPSALLVFILPVTHSKVSTAVLSAFSARDMYDVNRVWSTLVVDDNECSSLFWSSFTAWTSLSQFKTANTTPSQSSPIFINHHVS